jgi:crotonobetaine/carnitine-CoA ligase
VANEWPIESRVVGTALRRQAERQPDAPLLTFGDLRQSYGQFDASANRMAHLLSRLGVSKGDRVALMMPNSPEFLWSWFGAAKLGAIYVPINTDYLGDILRYQLAKAEVSHIVIDASFLGRLADVIDGVPTLRHVVVRGAAQSALPRVNLVSVTEMERESASDPGIEQHYTDPHAISFTSGTTGPSKGVLATNCHVTTFALDWIECTGFRPDDRLYSCLPQFHAIATWLGFLPTILSGASATVTERFSASRFWDDVRAANATVAHGIFSMIPILLKQPPRPDDATQPARVFYIGQQNEEFERRFNCRIVEVFGSTETGIVTYTPLDTPRRKGSCGKANNRTFDVMLVDDEDQEVAPGQVGEIVVRPRQPWSMLREYYGMPSETIQAFRNLWFHTGDAAKADADGYLYFVDRKKDAIRRRGENISSFELESVVNRMPEVLECAAVAVKSELTEDDVKIVIVRQPEAPLTAQQVWAFCEAYMPRFWVPRYVEFRDSLPKTPNQKVQKYLLRERSDAGDLHDRGEFTASARGSRAPSP